MSETKDILNIEEAAKLLGVSVKTFNKVLHSQCLPARKIGREWKFSRQHLIDWVGSGRSVDFYRESSSHASQARTESLENGSDTTLTDNTLTPARRDAEPNAERRTSGWRIELD